MTYQEKLVEAKKFYPFMRWRKSLDDGLEQYTEENCNNAQAIFDNLINELIQLGEKASEEQKISLFKNAILSTNTLNEACDECLIETGEREDLCELTNVITEASGLDPKKYGDGEGLATEWREW